MHPAESLHDVGEQAATISCSGASSLYLLSPPVSIGTCQRNLSRSSASTSAAESAGMQATGDGTDACSFQVQAMMTLPRSTSWSLQTMQQLFAIHQEAKVCHLGSQKGCAHVRGSPALWHPIHTPSSNPQPTLTLLKTPSQSSSCTGCAQQSGVTKILLLMWQRTRLSSKACPSWWQRLS